MYSTICFASSSSSSGLLSLPVVSTTHPSPSPIATATTAVISSPKTSEVISDKTQFTMAPGFSAGKSTISAFPASMLETFIRFTSPIPASLRALSNALSFVGPSSFPVTIAIFIC